MTDYSPILSRIADLSSGGRPGCWHGRCPCQQNHKNGDKTGRGSLRFWIDEGNGNLRVKCYKGCTWSEINQALGCSSSDWFPPVVGLDAWKKRLKISQERNEPVSIEATYDYRDEDGNLLFQVVKTVSVQNQKGFFQRRPIPGHAGFWGIGLGEGEYSKCSDGTWRIVNREPTDNAPKLHLPAIKPVLYRLKQLADNPAWPVLVCEGEKDCGTLAGIFEGTACCVTTAPMGAGKWKRHYGGHFAGRRVTVFPDNDDVGLDHALAVMSSAIAYGCESVRMVRWGPAFKDGGDVTDWIQEKFPNGSGTVKDKREAIAELVKRSEAYELKRAA